MRLILSVLVVLGVSHRSADAKRGGETPKAISIVVVGDVGLNRSKYEVHPDGQLEGAKVLPWKELTAQIAGLIDGDLNFMNLETVVTDRNDLKPGDKRQKTPYLFRSHPEGVDHLIGLGFNLISAANNHAWDYGEAGAKETVKHLQDLTEDKPSTVYSGVGLNVDEAARPAIVSMRGAKVALSSIGIVTNSLDFHRAGPNKAGTLALRHPVDWKRSLGELTAARADLKLLSVHYGIERDIRTDERQRGAWRAAIDSGVDMVIGHHAHVVRGIEIHKGKLIFYGLGNFLIRGAANMGKKPELRTCCDYGLLAKAHLVDVGKGYEVAALEAVPMWDMHRIAHPLGPAEASKRIEVLNVMAETLDDPKVGSLGVRFSIRSDGTGIYCTAAAKRATDEIKRLCKDYTGPAPVSEEVRRRVRAAPNPRSPKVKERQRKRAPKPRRRKR